MKVYYGCKNCGKSFDGTNAQFTKCLWTKNTQIMTCPDCKNQHLYVLIEEGASNEN